MHARHRSRQAYQLLSPKLLHRVSYLTKEIMPAFKPQAGCLASQLGGLPEVTVLWYVVQLMRAKPALFPVRSWTQTQLP
jgi:hypothetical protein